MTKKALKRKHKKTLNKWKTIYFITVLTGAILCIFEIGIYRLTMIKTIIPVSIIALVGLVTFYFNRGHFRKVYEEHWLIYAIIQNVVSWGFIACYLFMAANYYFSDNNVRHHTFEIKSKSWMSGSRRKRNERKPTVVIDYFGFAKELVFTFEDTESINAAKKINLSVKNGFFGFDVIDHYEIAEENW